MTASRVALLASRALIATLLVVMAMLAGGCVPRGERDPAASPSWVP